MKENRSLEFKSEVSKSFLKTVSAFANFGSGRILFGVADDGSACGLADPAQACLDIENRINDSITPRPTFALTVNEGDRTVELRVEEGPDKPYLCSGKAYRRSDSATIEVDKLELRRLVLEGENLTFEGLPSKEKALTFSILEERLKAAVGITALTDDLMRTLGLLNGDGYDNAAAILADENGFPGVDMARFGDSEDIILDREAVSGRSALESFDAAMAFFSRHCLYEKIEGAVRKTVETVPEKAFREAIANALAHRTWDVAAPVRVSVFPDRVEVLSPGGLPSGMSAESYAEGRYSMLRNPLLAEVLFRLGIIEKFGTGIKRIRRAYEGLRKGPSFEAGDDFVCVKLPVLSDTPRLTEEEDRVLACIPPSQMVARSLIEKATGFEKTKVIRVLNSLIGKGVIRSSGKGRATRYSR